MNKEGTKSIDFDHYSLKYRTKRRPRPYLNEWWLKSMLLVTFWITFDYLWTMLVFLGIYQSRAFSRDIMQVTENHTFCILGSIFRIHQKMSKEFVKTYKQWQKSNISEEPVSDHRRWWQNDRNHENRRKWTKMGWFGLKIGLFESHSRFLSIANHPRPQIPSENIQNPHFPGNRKIRKSNFLPPLRWCPKSKRTRPNGHLAVSPIQLGLQPASGVTLGASATLEKSWKIIEFGPSRRGPWKTLPESCQHTENRPNPGVLGK